jgi:ketosteroid isomerase-like protein
MPASAPARRPAHRPEELHAIVAHAFNAGDLEAFTDAYEHDATIVVPPEGRTVHGCDEIRAAVASLFELHPRMTSLVLNKIETGGLALTHGRWQLVVTEDGCL